ncbi:MAG: glycosyltransferase [Crocinitomicaceae bacterium]
MKVLFVCSGNKNDGPSDVVKNQYESLVNIGIQVDIYTIRGKGVLGYLKNIRPLRNKLKKENYDLIHAHYSLSGIIASLAEAKPLIVSLMGSDAHIKGWLKKITLKFQKKWDVTILKSKDMQEHLQLESFNILPNGVDTKRFCPIPKNEARNQLNLDLEDKLLVFIANPNREEKNFKLAQDAMNLVKTKNVKLIPVYNTPNEKIPLYLNAADVLVLSSKYEGSVNVVKEAMACNTPIVSTNVGDVQKNILGLQSCLISDNNPVDFAAKIDEVLLLEHRSNGRDRIFELQLDSVSVANKLKEIYKNSSERSSHY